jgi:hypothetical protein
MRVYRIDRMATAGSTKMLRMGVQCRYIFRTNHMVIPHMLNDVLSMALMRTWGAACTLFGFGFTHALRGPTEVLIGSIGDRLKVRLVIVRDMFDKGLLVDIEQESTGIDWTRNLPWSIIGRLNHGRVAEERDMINTSTHKMKISSEHTRAGGH